MRPSSRDPGVAAPGTARPATPPLATGRRLLWAALLLAGPVPFFLVERGTEPVAALLLLLAASLALLLREGAAGALPLACLMLGAQALIAAFAWAMLARLAARVLAAVFPRHAVLACCVAAAAIVAVACAVPLYRTPFRPGGLHASLLQVFE